MTVAAAHAAAFRTEVRRNETVRTLIEDGEFIAPHKPDGTRVMPFWSLETRARRVTKIVAAYNGLATRRFTLTEFLGTWLPWLREEHILVGVNWSGEQAVGYDCSADDVAGWFSDISNWTDGPLPAS